MDVMEGEKKLIAFADLPHGAVMQQRAASALNGLEVSDAIATQVGRLVEIDLAMGPVVAGMFHDRVLEKLRDHGRLNKEHLTYPRVSWVGSISVGENGTLGMVVEIWPDSIRDHAFTVSTGVDGLVTKFSFNQQRTDKPDEIRRRFGLPIRAQAVLPNGQTVTVLLPSDMQLSQSGLPTAAAQRMAKVVPAMGAAPPIAVNIEVGQLVSDQVSAQPRIAADDLVATPPNPELPTTPAPGAPGSIAKQPPAHLGKPPSQRRR